MGKKSYLSVGKFFTIAAMFISSMILFTGCGKLFMSDEKIANKFKVAMSTNFLEESEKKAWLSSLLISSVKIKESDGDDYTLEATFSSGTDNEITIEAKGTFDGDDLTWEISGEEMEKLYTIVIPELLQKELNARLKASRSSFYSEYVYVKDVKVEHVKGLVYSYEATQSNGYTSKGKVVFNDKNGALLLI